MSAVGDPRRGICLLPHLLLHLGEKQKEFSDGGGVLVDGVDSIKQAIQSHCSHGNKN